ncbi:MAG: hypothetical protein E7A38_03235, partial [Leclercia adecarboxylata]|nr:hypothetical protein [Leclercia adecarboxylata]
CKNPSALMRAGWCPTPALSFSLIEHTLKMATSVAILLLPRGFFTQKKSGPRGPQKFTLALVVRVLRETR